MDPEEADQFPDRVAGQAAPFQHDLCPGIGELSAEGKGIDDGRISDDRVVADIADLFLMSDGTSDHSRDGSRDEFPLIRPAVITAYTGIIHDRSAVEHSDIGIVSRDPAGSAGSRYR